MNKILSLALVMAISVPACAQKRAPQKPQKPAAHAVATSADTLDIKKISAAATAGNAAAQNSLGVCYYTGRKVKQSYEAALKWWSMAAKQKHAEAIGNMALCFQYGKGTKADSVMAVKLYKESVKLGNTALVKNREEALAKKINVFDACLLGDIYAHGVGVKKDVQKALGFYVKASDSKSMPATLAAAHIYEDAAKYPEAMKRYSMAAAADPFAAYKCGEFMCKGLGTAVDKSKAAELLKRAAAADIPNAQLLLGDLFYNGDGVERDVPKAIALYKGAALHGNPAAMWNVGVVYVSGKGIAADYELGVQWLALASQKGMGKLVAERLGMSAEGGQNGWKGTPVYDYMHGLSLLAADSRDVDGAVKCFSALEKQKCRHAAAMLAACYADRSWKKANDKKAVKYLEKAAADGDLAGLYALALRCENGDGVAANGERALQLLQKAADGGYVPALCHLGDLYNKGRIVNRNLTTAIGYYQRALKEGYLTESAAGVLADAYEKGLGGLKRNADMAQMVKNKVQTSDPAARMCKTLRFE